MDQVQEDVHKLAWNILLNSKHRGRETRNGQNIYSSPALHVELKEYDSLKQCNITKEVKQDIASGSKHRLQYVILFQNDGPTTHTCAHSPSLSFGNTVLGARATSSPADK